MYWGVKPDGTYEVVDAKKYFSSEKGMAYLMWRD